MPYRDLHEHVAVLERNGLLHRIGRLLDKNTEIHPLVRLQFRGLEEGERKAFLFENPTDCLGTKYPFPVLVGGLAPSQEIYAIGMQCRVEEIGAKWMQAMDRPVTPVSVEQARCQEVVHAVDPGAIPGTGLDLFPIQRRNVIRPQLFANCFQGNPRRHKCKRRCANQIPVKGFDRLSQTL